jgi:predicted histone-like DNA-binding protein
MLFDKKIKRKFTDVEKWHPQLITVGKPVTTQELANRLARESTVSPADVHAVIRALPEVMAEFMAESRSVHLDGLGSFHYTIRSTGNGVATEAEVSARQITAVRVQFVPTRQREGTTYTRSLVGDLSFTEWRGVDRPGDGGGEEPGEGGDGPLG